MRFRIEATTDHARLAGAIPQWERLASCALEPNPMYEHWMLLPALRYFGENVVCVLVWGSPSDGAGAPEVLAGVFAFHRARRFKGVPASALSSWTHKSWMLCTPLVHADHAPGCVGALLDWLERGGDEASVVEFRYLPTDGPFHGVVADALRERSSMVFAANSVTRAFLRKSEGAPDVQSSLAQLAGKSMRRKARRLAERGALRHVAMQAGDDATSWIEDFLRLEASGWKGRQGSALASSRENRLFALEMLSAAHARGRLQVMGLDLDGRGIARCCNIAAGEGAYAYRTAYDEAFGCYSPGVMAELDSLRHFHASPGLRWMDSITDPDNVTLNRLWQERRTLQTVVVGWGAWGELWVSMMPMLRWAKRRIATTKDVIARVRRASAPADQAAA